MFFDHYPYTNFHNVNLDWVLQAVKAWGRTVEANDRAFKDLKEANESFKAYVKNYLQDLDITDEINTKLDRMLAEGTLTPYFAPYVKGYVESWLANNVTPTTPALDKTLSLDDAAANAAATGERIERAAYLRTLDGPKLSNLLNKNLIIPGYRIQSACKAGGYFYVCGGSEAADGKGFIAKMSSLDFKDAEITYYTDLGHANDITYSYNTNHLYVTTVGEGVEWGIWNINPNDLTDKTLITNCPENTIGIQYVGGWVFVLAPPRIYRTLDFETYTLVINNTNEILNKFSIQSDNRISQTLVRLPNDVVGWVGSYIKEPEHIWYGFIAYFGSHGAITFDVFPTYNAECQAAIWDEKSTVYVISNGTTSPAYTVLRMDCGDLKYLELGTGKDLNNYTGEGLFYLIGAATMDNCPVNNEGLTLKVSRQGLLNTRQDIFTNSGRHLYRIKLFNAGTWSEWVEQAAEIAQIKEDLSAVSESTINALLSVAPTWSNGSAVKISDGANQGLTWACRTNYIALSQPTMIRFGFDLTKYEYNIWAYTALSVSSAIRNLTGSVRVDNESYIYVPASGERCIRICVALKTKSGTLTDEELTTISNSISFYTATDKSLKLSNVAADSAATGIAIGKAQSVIQSGDICPKHIDGETVLHGITVVAKNGVYKISGTATANDVYNLFYNESALPSGIEAGKSYKLKVNIPSLYTNIRVAYYNGSEWSLIYGGTYDTEFTVPVDAVGFYVRFFFYNNVRNSPQFEVSPRIYPLNSIGEVEGESTPSHYPMMMTIIDDDGYGSFYTDLLPLCIEKCAPIASAVVTAKIGVSTGFMTWEQIEECSRKGAEILSHGYNHKKDSEILAEGTTVEQLAMWYRGARNELELHGIRSDIFVFNNNTAKLIQCQQAARRVYKAAFHASGDEINHEGTTNPFYIKRFDFTASTRETAHTIEEMKANIDTLAEAGTGWLVWMIHTSSTNGWSSDEVTKLGQAIDYARSLGIEIVTAERGCRTYLPYQGI